MTDPAPLSYAEIREYAERVGEKHQIYDAEGRADLGKLLAALGGTVVQHESRESMRVRAPQEFEIFLPSFTSTRRDRFTIAHEVAHYFLHYLQPGKTNAEAFQRGGRSLAETQANVFASSLLMPKQAFTAAFGMLDGNASMIARRFDVSPAAAEVRAQVLELA